MPIGKFDAVDQEAGTSGYFDGDGTVTLRVQGFTLDFGLQFSDGYRAQLEQLRYFLSSEKVYTGEITKNSYEKCTWC
jgi:hypothetical protein